MNSTMEKVSPNKVKLRMELEADAFEAAMQKAYLKTRGRINVPGFRKGKAPRKLIERMYGESVFYEEAFDAVFPDLYKDAVEQNDLNPVGDPDIDIETITGGEPLVVTAEIYVYPEVELAEYKGLNVARPDDKVDEEAVDQEIGRIRDRNAREEEIEDRPVQEDDIVGLDYAGSVDGVPFDGGTAEGQTLTIGSGQFIPGFEEQLVGMKIGEERDINVTFPAEYHSEDLAGKEAVFHVKINSIRVRELPELDDEFAKDVSEFDTLDEYKASIRKQLEENASTQADAQFENALVDAVIDASTIDVPPPMIERRIDRMMYDMAMRMAYQGLRMEDYLRYTGQTQEAMREQFKDEAERFVKGQLVLEAIRKAENVEPSEADIDASIARYATQSGQEEDAFRKDLTDEQMEAIRDDAAITLVLDLLKREAKPEAEPPAKKKATKAKADDADAGEEKEPEKKKAPARKPRAKKTAETTDEPKETATEEPKDA